MRMDVKFSEGEAFKASFGSMTAMSDEEAFAAGQTDGYRQCESDFWDAFQDHGKRVTYMHGFREWGGEYIRPKYVVKPYATSVNSMFRDATKLKMLEAAHFDLSDQMTSVSSATNGNQRVFQGCTALEIIEDLGMRASYYDATFKDCVSLKTIEVLRFSSTGSKTQITNITFENCTSLENITISGVIEVTINFQWCPLTAASAKSVINALKNYAGTSSAYANTVSFSESTLAALDAEGNASPNGNSWGEYLTNIGWLY